MFTYEYTFYPKQLDDEFIDEYSDDINDYLGTLSNNGIIKLLSIGRT